MDMAKHDVKQAKTTEQIERRAVLYQQQVELFDDECNNVRQIQSVSMHFINNAITGHQTRGRIAQYQDNSFKRSHRLDAL